jgi:Flp pilus assembly protein TadG
MRRRNGEHGQLLVLFTIALVAILTIAALLLDGAHAFVTRRTLQNAADAAALAGANVMQAANTSRSCTETGYAGSPRPDIVAAAVASVVANVPGYTTSDVTVTCPGGYDNQAVKVDLRETSPNFLAGFVLGGPINVRTTSTAVNGQITGSLYSVVTLNPWKPSFAQGKRGCPSFLLSGGPTVILDGSVMVDSACPAAEGGAFATNGNASTVTANNGSRIRMTGGYSPGPLVISPAPQTGQKPVPDPLAFLDASPLAGLTVRSNSKLTLSNETRILEPGIYTGGIELRNSSIALLKPGVYVIQGGGLNVGSQAQFCSIPAGSTVANCSNWAAECADTNCGVLLYNTGTANGGGALSDVRVAAGAVLRLRAYDDRANAGQFPEFRNLLIWQSASPVPTSSYEQPWLYLNGGGNVSISGTLYAPSAKVHVGGGSGGSGGNLAVTLQFICWDLEFEGNSTFRFYFSDDDFARPTDYGLVQ